MFGILTLISLSLKNKTKSKNLCLVKFEVLGYQITKKMSIISISDPKVNLNRLGCVIMHLVNHLIKTSGYPFWY